jgi:nucleotide-binding universal stress UspA family protein
MADQQQQPIIVGVDGSDLSVAALRHARVLAQALGCPVEAITVWHYHVAPGTFTPALWNPAGKAQETLEEALVRAFGRQAPAGIRARTIQGQPAKALVEAGRHARMLVLGSRGHGGLTALLLGSVTAACAAHAPCPVLIVRAGPADEPARKRRTARSEEKTMNTPAGLPPDAAQVPAQAAVLQHHEQMRHRLKSLASALAHSVAAGDAVAGHEAHAVLVEWCERDLVPHVLAEEDKLYGPAAGLPGAGLLVEGLLDEHRALVDLVEELRGTDGLDGAVLGRCLERIFALHTGKEDKLLLPQLAAAPGLPLAEAVAGLVELVGEAHVR